MDFTNKAYIRLTRSSENQGRRQRNYNSDLRYLENFLAQRGVDYSVVFSDNHDAELSPLITLKEPGEVPIDYLPAWLKIRKFRESADSRIKRIAEALSDRFLEEMLSGVIGRKERGRRK